jgi:(R,R)-butanediol dehydrogenase/meso-butanediol dehydrogenase/diacetyl reductase
MRALVYEGPRQMPVVDVPEPSLGAGEALVRVRLVGICGTDLHLWSGAMPEVRPPRIPGHEVVGEVVRGGDLPPGTRVAVEPLISCGVCRPCREGDGHVCQRLQVLGVHADGGAAEYLKVPVQRLHPLPDHLSWETAALAEPTAVAVHMVAMAAVQRTDVVLVLGGGPIGYLVAQVARAEGARQVLVAEVAPERAAFCRNRGLKVLEDEVVARTLADTRGDGADVVIEATGQEEAATTMVAAVRIRGRVVVGGLHARPRSVDLRAVSVKEVQLMGSRVYRREDVRKALSLLAARQLPLDGFVSRVVSLDDAVEQGFLRLAARGGEMKVLIAPGQDGG